MKDKDKILKLQIIGFFIISIIGTLLHFTYEWSGNSTIVGLFSPVNESVWEHLKLGTFATLIFMIYEHIKIGKNKNYIVAKLSSVLTQIITILVIFYTSRLFIEESMIIDILSFYVAILLGQIVSYKILTSSKSNSYINFHSKVIFVFIIFLFYFFTFYPLHIEMFKDPLTNTYGIFKVY